MLSRVINQLLTGTEWGSLVRILFDGNFFIGRLVAQDYLIVDCPPGTGDPHLTLAQIVPVPVSFAFANLCVLNRHEN